MLYPSINNIPQSREIITTFNGLNETDTCNESQFKDCNNLLYDEYPRVRTRNKAARFGWNTLDTSRIIGGDSLTYLLCHRQSSGIKLDGIVIDGELAEVPEGTEYILNNDAEGRSLVKMGAYICIFPEGIIYNTQTEEFNKIHATYNFDNGTDPSDPFDGMRYDYRMTDENCDNILVRPESYYETHAPQNNDCKFVGDSVSRYSSVTQSWAPVDTTITFYLVNYDTHPQQNPEYNFFRKGDNVKICLDPLSYSDLIKDMGSVLPDTEVINGTTYRCGTHEIIKLIADDTSSQILSFSIKGFIHDGNAATVAKNVSGFFERPEKNMAFVCECNNRLWGCNEAGNEIYASKLGDPLEWNAFQGIATDSWAATVGSEGVFTGAVSYQGYPTFFKENSILRISISQVGAHSYKEIQCKGLKSGNANSVVLINSVLYYRTLEDVCAFDGSYPVVISSNLGKLGEYTRAARYKDSYVMGNNGDMLMYDTRTGIWSKQSVSFLMPSGSTGGYSNSHAIPICSYKNDLVIAIREPGGIIPWSYRLGSFEGKAFDFTPNDEYPVEDIFQVEDDITWHAESCEIGYHTPDKKYLTRFDLRMQVSSGATVSIYVEYDSSGYWEHVKSVSGYGTKTYAIPVRPKRCDHFRYRIEGSGGDVKLYSITKVYEEGSDM